MVRNRRQIIPLASPNPAAGGYNCVRTSPPTVLAFHITAMYFLYMSDTPHPGGRPTKYQPEYCERVIEWGKLGKSKAWMACEIGVHRETLDNWASAHEEFFDALKVADQFSLRWWEDAGQEALYFDKFQTGLWTQNMSNRFGLCRTKIDAEHTGSFTIELKRYGPDSDPA